MHEAGEKRERRNHDTGVRYFQRFLLECLPFIAVFSHYISWRCLVQVKYVCRHVLWQWNRQDIEYSAL